MAEYFAAIMQPGCQMVIINNLEDFSNWKKNSIIVKNLFRAPKFHCCLDSQIITIIR